MRLSRMGVSESSSMDVVSLSGVGASSVEGDDAEGADRGSGGTTSISSWEVVGYVYDEPSCERRRGRSAPVAVSLPLASPPGRRSAPQGAELRDLGEDDGGRATPNAHARG